MTSVPRVSIVVPVYNSEATLNALVERIERALLGSDISYEIVLVNDGSSDESWQRLLRLASTHLFLQALDLMRNYGQHNALLAGIRVARGEVIVTMDDDLQHPPEAIPALLAELDAGHDVVYATPISEPHQLWRVLAAKITKLALASATGVKTARNVSAYRAFRTHLREAFASYQSPFVSVDVLLTWSTVRFSSVPVRHEPRMLGRSNYTFSKLVTHALNMMTGFSTWPLRVASLVGFAFTVIGAGVLVAVVATYLFVGRSVAGFPFLASIIAIFAGAQMFALGIIGEYLSRMHFRMMERPTYSVREHIGGEPPC